MYVKLSIPERLKDLRVVDKHLTLEQLAEQTGLSKSALGKYESDEYKDISPFAIATLAEFYGVSTDYLMGLTETKNHPNTALHELHLSDDVIDVLKSGKLNNRLLCEMVTHENFRRFLVDAEIYIDRIADMRINDLNVMLDMVRLQAMEQQGAEDGDLYMRTLELAQVQPEGYFAPVISGDLITILNDIREAHKKDTTTADEYSPAAEVARSLQEAMSFEGSPQEKRIRGYLATLGIDYDTLTKEEFITLIGILKKSKKLKGNQGSRRGKASPQFTHGKGKRKRK